jgi:polysaccharide export outer membrane protein
VSRNIYMKDRDLVYVPDNVAKKAFVLGEVVQPTAVQIERDSVTLAEALAAARGPTPASARRELAVIRGGFAKPIVYHIELEKALLYDDRIKLRSGDRVIVAPTGLAMASRYMQQLLPFLVGAQALGFTASGASNVAAQAAVQGGN